MQLLTFYEGLNETSLPLPISIKVFLKRLYYYDVLVLWATGGQARCCWVYCHGLSSIYAVSKKGIYKVRPGRVKEYKGMKATQAYARGGGKHRIDIKLDPLRVRELQRRESPTH